MSRAGATNSVGNWNNVGVSGITGGTFALSGQTGYTYTIPSTTAGTYTVALTVNSGAVTCNTTSITVASTTVASCMVDSVTGSGINIGVNPGTGSTNLEKRCAYYGQCGGTSTWAQLDENISIRLRIKDSSKSTTARRFWAYNTWRATAPNYDYQATLGTYETIPADPGGGSMYIVNTTPRQLLAQMSAPASTTKVLINGFEEPSFNFDAKCVATLNIGTEPVPDKSYTFTAVPKCAVGTVPKPEIKLYYQKGVTGQMNFVDQNSDGVYKTPLTLTEKDMVGYVTMTYGAETSFMPIGTPPHSMIEYSSSMGITYGTSTSQKTTRFYHSTLPSGSYKVEFQAPPEACTTALGSALAPECARCGTAFVCPNLSSNDLGDTTVGAPICALSNGYAENGENIQGCFQCPPLPATCAGADVAKAKASGDANGDCEVTGKDYAIWLREWSGIESTTRADFDGDGKVSGSDFAIWLQTWSLAQPKNLQVQ